MVDRAAWKSVWLAEAGAPAGDGHLPVIDAVPFSQLAVFAEKTTIGDATKDSDQFLSAWIQGDWSGGGQIEEINEGSDLARFWFGVADTRSPNRVSLPPEAVAVAAPGGAGGAHYPLGDLFDEDYQRTRHAAAWGTSVYCFNEATDAFDYGPGTAALGAEPVGKGVSWNGLLYVPLGAWGYATARDQTADPGVPLVANFAADATHPAAVDFAVFGRALVALAADGFVWQITADETTWTPAKDGEQKPLRLDRSRAPKKLAVYHDRLGNEALFVVSDRDAWVWDPNYGLRLTDAQFPPHPDFGTAAAVWRTGEDLWIAAGMDCVSLTSANVIVPLKGPVRDDGVPTEYRGRIVDLQPEPSCLYALVEGDAAADAAEAFVEDGAGDDPAYLPDAQAYSALFAWTGVGWHALWGSAAAAGGPTWMCVSTAGGYRLWWGDGDGTATTMELRRTMHNPKQGLRAGIDRFAQTGHVETGRFDAAMKGFGKLAQRVSLFLDEGTATEYVEISFQTDADPAGAWRFLGRASGPGLSTFWFDPDGDGFAEGLAFNWIRFRFDFARGSDPTRTPLLNAFVLHFVKIPQDTSSFTLEVPLPKRRWQGRTADEIKRHVVGLLTARTFLRFVHQDRAMPVRLAGVSGQEATGEDHSGVLRLALIRLGEEERAA